MIILLICLFSFLSFYLAKRRILSLIVRYRIKPKSLPAYYGLNIGLWNFSASIVMIILLYTLKKLGLRVNYTYAYLSIIGIFLSFVIYIFASLRGRFRAQLYFEKTISVILKIAALASILITLAILFSILFEAIAFFQLIPIDNFLFEKTWSPEEDKFGVLPILTGTLLITGISVFIALPLGLLAAIYLNEYCSSQTRNALKPMIEMLSGVPSIVYGYFAALIVGPGISNFFKKFGIEVPIESALAAGIVMGIMIIPFILSLSDDAIYNVPKNLKEAALALGSTKAESITKVIVPAASSGIMNSVLLAISRAIGETMIVVMAAGINANLTINPLHAVTTFTVQIANLLVGDQEFDNPHTLSAFALAITLFFITLLINICAIIIFRKKKQNYE